VQVQPPLYLIGLFPFFFAGMWFFVTTRLTKMCGWQALSQRYPDQDERPILRLRGQSGQMGANVNLNGILTLDACSTGLRIGIWRIFGPFSRPFLVPWAEIQAGPQKALFMDLVRLTFSQPPVGNLSLASAVWARLSAATPGGAKVTVNGYIKPIPNRQLLLRLSLSWLLLTAAAAAFFQLAPRLLLLLDQGPVAAHATTPPLLVTILAPAIVLGIGVVGAYLSQRSR